MNYCDGICSCWGDRKDGVAMTTTRANTPHVQQSESVHTNAVDATHQYAQRDPLRQSSARASESDPLRTQINK